MIQQFQAYTDGSADNMNPQRPGGSAYIIFDKGGQEVRRASKGFINTTSNRMELLAIMSVINALPPNSSVTIHSDSQYSINVLSRKWQASDNLDQITKYWSLCKNKNINVLFEWVRGHNGNVWNELCDKMARWEYHKILKSAERKTQKPKKVNKSKKAKSKKYGCTNAIEEQYYSQITTKNKRKKSKKK